MLLLLRFFTFLCFFFKIHLKTRDFLRFLTCFVRFLELSTRYYTTYRSQPHSSQTNRRTVFLQALRRVVIANYSRYITLYLRNGTRLKVAPKFIRERENEVFMFYRMVSFPMSLIDPLSL